MNRLIHSTAGNVRSLQISRRQLFVFVEGALDRAFIDRILERRYGEGRAFYEIRAAKELPGNTGGKIRLINMFKALRRRKALSGDKFGKRFTTLFLLDKDIDEVARAKVRSRNVVYTSTYDLEGHLLCYGDLSRAVADAAGITRAQASAALGLQEKFLSKLVYNWREWIALCMLSQLKRINVGCTFDRCSSVNPCEISPANQALVAECKMQIAERLQLSAEEVHNLYTRYERKLLREIAVGRPFTYFKGKWIRTILQKYAHVYLNVPDALQNSLGDRVLTALVAQVGASANCPLSHSYSEILTEVEDILWG